MTIEIKQLQIKSNVLTEANQASRSSQPSLDYDSIKEDVLAECRKLVLEIMRLERER